MDEEEGSEIGLPVRADLPECSAKRRVRFLSVLPIYLMLQ